ncbi:carbamoyltransferase HypF [Crenobacter caeni]|uniref:Carbamoyltransferase HypF n=1 Tax=Crenobacter caeni TaxID=2705474 RepID=A0A6B2KVM3_9NEIS|nr:carbamoyltransferase HypF [Crenobacter caeni]NDV14053.1 carbamoyltransferase HypF [Crenobacter caeni]
MNPCRIKLTFRGRVQGVGFRPYVWRTVKAYPLTGFVRNTGAGVDVELQGDPQQLRACRRALTLHLPPLARVDTLDETRLPLIETETQFEIADSQGKASGARIPTDIATCPNCLNELFDGSDRRYRYAFTNCTDCGPRYTITHSLPYDRAETSMSAFELCPACCEEYEDPASRRFHAEPNACPQCGPRLMLTDRFGQLLKGDPIAGALQIIGMGRSVAMKGLGGFHLVCDATRADAVERLRGQKKRQQKPLAVMVLNVESARRLCHVSDAEAEALASVSRPIVLLSKKEDIDALLPGVAPGLSTLGVMLPYTPMQWLLFHEALGRPQGSTWRDEACDRVWVMTSANPSGEPIVTNNQEARERLNQVADVFLLHNRNIVVRCDDSVLALHDGQVLMHRRARGYAPDPVLLQNDGPNVLATGVPAKNTLTVLRGREAFVSQHVGDVGDSLSCQAMEEVCHHLLELTAVRPEAIACDLDPSHYPSELAEELSGHFGIPLIHVQHQHAHIGAVLAEHGRSGPVLGLALDGLGDDGKAWGGELLRCAGGEFTRLGQLAPLPLIGGTRAVREPWLMAVGLLCAMGEDAEAQRRFGRHPAWPAFAPQLGKPFDGWLTSSLALWTGAIAALAGLCKEQRFDNEAQQKLEEMAEDCAPLPGGWRMVDGQLDLSPLVRHLLTLEDDACAIASLWHATLAAALGDWTVQAARQADLGTVAIAGGCCANRRLMSLLLERLTAAGLSVLRPIALPPNDGGLSLGQAWVARQKLLEHSLAENNSVKKFRNFYFN